MIRSMLLALLAATPARAHIPMIVVVDPTMDWCMTLQMAMTGDVYLFTPGEYLGSCDFTGPIPDYVGEQMRIESYYPQTPAVFRFDGSSDHVFGVSGWNVAIRYVEIADVPAGADAIRLTGEGHLVQGVTTSGFGGNAIVQSGDLAYLEVRENVLTLGGGTAVSLGCLGCTSTDAFVHDNLITGADVGIAGAEGAWGTLRDNFVGGGASAVTWAGNDAWPTLLEENFWSGSAQAVHLSGGLVTMRNDIAVGAPALRLTGPGSIAVLGSTLYAAAADGAIVEGFGAADTLAFRDNAVSGAIPAPGVGQVDGNVACDASAGCWVDPDGLDFWAPPGSPLRTGGVATDSGDLGADWCGHVRGSPPTVGALEALSVDGPGPISLVLRTQFDCSLPDDPPEDTGILPGTGTPAGGDDTGGSPDAPKRAAESGCGCDGAALPAAPVPVLLVALAVRRRRRIWYTSAPWTARS